MFLLFVSSNWSQYSAQI